jgi:hypothetical protein
MKNKCRKCSKREATDLHHIDEDRKNNDPTNLQELCALCHAKLHGISPKKSELKRLVIFRDRATRIRIALDNQVRGFSKIEYLVPTLWQEERRGWHKAVKRLEKEIKATIDSGDYPIWDWLKEIKGISHTTAAKLIAHIDIHNSPTVSALWRYCGLDATHIKRKKGMKKEKALKFGNPCLKKEFRGVLADSFIKQRTLGYREIYDSEKERQIQVNGLTKGHAHNRAKRKMVKIFIEHLWVQWRQMEGLSTRKPFVIERLGHANYLRPAVAPSH